MTVQRVGVDGCVEGGRSKGVDGGQALTSRWVGKGRMPEWKKRVCCQAPSPQMTYRSGGLVKACRGDRHPGGVGDERVVEEGVE